MLESLAPNTRAPNPRDSSADRAVQGTPITCTSRDVAIASWAVGGVALTFVEAIYRLGLRALETIAAGLTSYEWTLLVGLTLLFGYGEGYRALHQRFSPRVVARAYDFSRQCRGMSCLLAPFVAVSLYGSGLRQGIAAWSGVGLIVLAIITVRSLPDPWRGIVDGAVAVALTGGFTSLCVRFVGVTRTLSGRGLARTERVRLTRSP